jgi:hypothetical protein
MPTSVAGFKQSLAYVLASGLRADEALPPGARPLGVFKGQPVFARAAVVPCLPADAWMRKFVRALRPGGWLAIWSAAPDDAFTKRLQRAGFEVEVAVVRARQGGGGGHRHTIWLAQRGDRPAGAPPEAPRRAPPRRRRV